MKKITLLILTTILSGGFIQAQTYNGKLGYGISPLGHPNDFSQFGIFLQEVANTCSGGVVFANAEWRDSHITSGIIPSTQKITSSLQSTPYAYTDMINFAWRSGDS